MKRQYARVMHHISGLTAANDNSDMIRGGEDELMLIERKDIPEGIDLERLAKLGAIREATPDEVKRWEVSKGLRSADEDDDTFARFTTGNPGGAATVGAGAATVGAGADDAGKNDDASALANAGAALGGTGGAGSAGHQETTNNPKGMTKGELSEFSVPELKAFAKEQGIEGYNDMKKDDLLDALTSQQPK
jgi:hypothetical protein